MRLSVLIINLPKQNNNDPPKVLLWTLAFAAVWHLIGAVEAVLVPIAHPHLPTIHGSVNIYLPID